jgi:hypothetical protein
MVGPPRGKLATMMSIFPLTPVSPSHHFHALETA